MAILLILFTFIVFPKIEVKPYKREVREIKEKADLVGIKNICYYGKDPIIYSDESEESYIDFIIRKINE